MSKRFLLVGLAVVLSAALLLWLVQLGMEWDYARKARAVTDEEWSEMMTKKHGPAVIASQSVERLDWKRKIRLAIGNIGLASAEESGRVSDLVLTELGDVKGLELVERQELDKALNELSLSASGLMRAKDAVRVGKLVRADWFLLGSPLRLNGTNFIVVRIVDARTGVLRQGMVFGSQQTPTLLATELADFVRRCRQDAAEGKSPVYLSVGGFADLSVNNRQAAFPLELRSYLVAAYQNSQVTMLEREFTEALLNETWLDLAGLTDESDTGATAMQAAYWMVDGAYQSYETSALEVELELKIQRMFGRSTKMLLRAKPGEPLFRQAKESIDLVMLQDVAALTPTRKTEIHARLENGKDLARLGNPTLAAMGEVGLVHPPEFQDSDETAVARQRRNIEEAVRAFQTVLLLSPTNREAKMHLAACLRIPSIGRSREAREIYRELLDEHVQDKWMTQAQRALLWSFRLSSPGEKSNWFAAACRQGSNSPSAEFYCSSASEAADDVTLQQGEGDKVVELAEQRLREAIRSTKHYLEGKGGTSYGDYGMYAFCGAFKSDRAAAASALSQFLPELQAEFPQLAPHLVAEALAFQADTNTALLGEFLKQVDWCLENPRDVFAGKAFWDASRYSAYPWLAQQGLYQATIRVMEAYQVAVNRKDVAELRFEERDRIALAFAYMGAERWQDALEIFESFTNKSVTMNGNGPWGRAFDPVLTGKQAAWCREKLGMVAADEPIEQELGKELLCLHTPSDFLVAEESLWVAVGDELLNLSFDLATNLLVKLPNHVAVTCLAIGGGKVWVGTSGDGLIEYDRASKRCRTLTEADGLLMNYITGLHRTEHQLWIGYGGTAGGGLGSLDLRTGKMTAYTQSLVARGAASGTLTSPPRTAVGSILSTAPEALWMLVTGDRGPRRFRIADGAWEIFPTKWGEAIGCFAMGNGQILAGAYVAQVEVDLAFKPGRFTNTNEPQQKTFILSGEELSRLEAELRTNSNQYISRQSGGRVPPKGSVLSFGLVEQDWRLVGASGGLPAPPSAIAASGDQLWVGGESYLARVDLDQNQIRKTFAIQARTVDRIQLGGGYVWALFDKHLRRAALRDFN